MSSLCKNHWGGMDFIIDDKLHQLIEEARQIGGHKTSRQAVAAALEEYVRRRQQMRIIEAFGTIDFDPTYDYKAERRRKAHVKIIA